MRASITERLEAAYTPEADRTLGLAARIAGEHGWQLYLNGGWVRDALLGIPNGDFDLSVVGDAHKLAHLLAEQTGGEVRVHDRFDTATVTFPDESKAQSPRSKVQNPKFQLDLVTARRETYATPGALPLVEASTIEDDLARRDFTINAMAARLTREGPGELLDPHGGLADLEAGLVRVLHDMSFIDDPTRLLRAVRFAERLGFRIERGTLELALQAVRDGVLFTVSIDRVVRELLKVLEERKAGAMLPRLQELGLLQAIHPNLYWPYAPERLVIPADEAITPRERRDTYLTAIGAEFAKEPHEASQLAQALKLTAPQVRLMHDAARLAQLWARLGEGEMTPSQVYNLLQPLDVNALVAYGRINALSADKPAWDRLHHYLSTTRHTKPFLNGEDLKRMGLPPGPRYKRALKSLLEARLDGKTKSQADEESFIRTWLEHEGLSA